MLLNESYWDLYRIRSYAEDAISIRESKPDVMERFDIAYFYAFFKALENLGEAVRQSDVKFLRRIIRGIDWKEYADKNVSVSHRLDSVRLSEEESSAALTIPGLISVLEASEDFYRESNPEIADIIYVVKISADIVLKMLLKDKNDDMFLQLLYDLSLIKSIQGIGEEMSKDKNAHLIEQYPELDWDTFINLRPVLAHTSLDTISIKRLEHLTHKNIPKLADNISVLIDGLV